MPEPHKVSRSRASKYAQGRVIAPPRDQDGFRRKELFLLMNDLGLGQQSLAEVLSEETGDKITVTAVQRWMASPDKAYSRSCPGWPIAILRYRAAAAKLRTRAAGEVRAGSFISRGAPGA